MAPLVCVSGVKQGLRGVEWGVEGMREKVCRPYAAGLRREADKAVRSLDKELEDTPFLEASGGPEGCPLLAAICGGGQ